MDNAMYTYSSTGLYVGQYRSHVNRVGNAILAMGQAFFARVAAGRANGSVTFRNSHRLTAPSATAFQRPTAEMRPLVQLTLQSTSSSLLYEAPCTSSKVPPAASIAPTTPKKLPTPPA